MEDYLKAIYELSRIDERVTTSQIAERLECTPASVTNMLQKLSSLNLVEYARYRGVRLTSAGKKVALEVLRHHRLIELYLSEVLGYSWDKVHDEADRLEHVISEEFEDRIDEALGFPATDPHGDPIPTKDGQVSEDEISSLWEAPEGQALQIQRVSDRNSEVLRHLASLGIYPQVRFALLKKAPFNGPVHIRLEGKEHILSEELARQIFVTPI
jgi:DtxR family Mn-dependent transcriptional regulator